MKTIGRSEQIDKIKTSEAGGTLPILYFYMDGKSKDLVNIGYGFHFTTWSQYRQLFQDNNIFFTWKAAEVTGRPPVTLDDVKKDFDLVRSRHAGKAQAERLTLTRASASGLDRVFLKFFQKQEMQAASWYNDESDIKDRIVYPALVNQVFDRLPDNAKFVIIDMFYNAGPGVMKQFKGLKAAIKMGDWDKAAKECRFREYANQKGIKIRNDERSAYLLALKQLNVESPVAAPVIPK